MGLREQFLYNVQLQKEWAGDRNPVTPEAMLATPRERAWWRCDRGHTWQATLESRIYGGRGCPVCANQIVLPGENDAATLAPEIAKLWHPTRNGNLSASDITPGSGKHIWWLCEKGHEWRAPVYSLKAGTSCPYCSGRNAISGETDLATTHPQFVKLWSERNRLSPTQVTSGSHKSVWWRCERGHEWEALVVSVVTDGCGCPYCAGKRAIPGETDLATVRPDILTEWDYEKNAGTDPGTILPSSHEKVWWRCALGHSWQAVVFSRTREQAAGCPYCTGRKVLPGFNDLATLRPKVAEEWYQSLNGDLKPEHVTLGSNKRVWWRCREGHVWQAVIYSRTRKRNAGCPVCAGVVKQRRQEAVPPRKKAYPRTRPEEGPASVNV